MKLLINNIEFRQFNTIDVQLTFECVASAFSIDVFFDPNNIQHREIFKPGNYAKFELLDAQDNLLITGVILRVTFKSNATKSLVKVSGYSTTGVLDDCEIPLQCYPLQANNLTLLQICERLCAAFGIGVVVDPLVLIEANSKIVKSIASESQSLKTYLSDLCASKQIILSHTAKGELLLTRANTNQQPIYYFDESNTKAYEMTLDFNGQNMHSEVGAVRQASKAKGGGLSGQYVLKNPYVDAYRTSVKKQSSGDRDNDTSNTARNILSEELRNLSVNIQFEGHYLNNQLVKPGAIISVYNPELYLFKPTLLFIESVSFKSDVHSNYTSIICYIPEVYNSDSPKNIFENG